MPIYEYRCNDCKKVIEEHQGFNDKPLTKCKECGGALKRIFSPAGIIFKGSGFHITDNRKDKAERTETKTQSPKKTKSRN
ncbi:MAG: FmdB family zinc ribbon protein [Candidatus Margulisiibacteriota bacterium]